MPYPYKPGFAREDMDNPTRHFGKQHRKEKEKEEDRGGISP
jgi:hypothetical protein